MTHGAVIAREYGLEYVPATALAALERRLFPLALHGRRRRAHRAYAHARSYPATLASRIRLRMSSSGP
jgi:hypothetical protein